MLVDFALLAAEACFGPLFDVTVDVGPYESGSNETSGGGYARV